MLIYYTVLGVQGIGKWVACYVHVQFVNILHCTRCPAGVGKWGACYVQPAIPYTDPEETTFDNPFLGTKLGL